MTQKRPERVAHAIQQVVGEMLLTEVRDQRLSKVVITASKVTNDLSLAQVYGALAYYHANRDEMDAHMAAEEAESDRIEQEHLRLHKRGA